MAFDVQIVIDCHGPRALGAFWIRALGYVEEPPPPGFATWDEALDAWGVPRDDRDIAYAIADPAGHRPRVFFQRVPEHKTVKNRVHLDVRRSAAAGVDHSDRPAVLAVVRAAATELTAIGATVLREVDDPREGAWLVMADPEGNEFCLT